MFSHTYSTQRVCMTHFWITRIVWVYRERMWNVIQGWQRKKLSKIGKKLLIKFVAQAIPTYCMMTFLLPTCLTDELERMFNSFWWGSGLDWSKDIWCMTRERLRAKKEVGGLGFRKSNLFNHAMLGKIGWCLIANAGALVCWLLKTKYFP